MQYTVSGNTTFNVNVVADNEEEAKKYALVLLHQGKAIFSHPLMVNIELTDHSSSSEKKD